MPDDVLAQWDPDTMVNMRTARVQTRFAVDWLQRDGGRRIRAGAVLARVYAITAGMPR